MRIFDRTTLSPLLLESVLSNPTRGFLCTSGRDKGVSAGRRTHVWFVCSDQSPPLIPSVKNETFHVLLHIYLYSQFLPKQRGKKGRVGGEDAGGRSQRSLTLKATPCLHGTVFQRAHCDPAKGKPQEETRGESALRRSCHPAGLITDGRSRLLLI